MLLLFLSGAALLVVAGTDLLDSVLSLFSFERGNGGRILGLAVFAVIVLFLLTVRSLVQSGRIERKLSAALEGIAWDEFRSAGLAERFRDRVAVVIPAYNEEDNIGQVLPRIPASVCGLETVVLVVDDGSRDRTGDIARAHGAAVARHVTNLGGGAALRTGYRLMVDSGAQIVVTLDADGQHRPEEMERLVGPIVDGTVDMAHGSRVLGHAEPNHVAREMGIIFFNRLVSLITRTKVSDCSNGYRAVRASVLPAARAAPGAVPHVGVHDRGDQARRARDRGRRHGRPPDPRALEEAGRAALRPRLHQRDHAHVAAVARAALAAAVALLAFTAAPAHAWDEARYWAFSDRVQERVDDSWSKILDRYNPHSQSAETMMNANMLLVHATAALRGYHGPSRQDARARSIATQLVTQTPPWLEVVRDPQPGSQPHAPGWTASMHHERTGQHLVVDGEVADALVVAWRARDAIGLDPNVAAADPGPPAAGRGRPVLALSRRSG